MARKNSNTHRHAPHVKSGTLLTELLNIGLVLTAILLLVAIIKLLVGDSLPQTPALAMYLTPLPSPSCSPSPSLTPSLTPSWTAAPSATPSASATPRPTNTRVPTITPRPSDTPSPIPSLTPVSPRGMYPPSVTPDLTAVYSDTPAPEPAPLIDFPAGTVNIVLLGSDKRPDETGWRTDTVIVASIDPNIPAVTMLSIPRDLWLYVPNWTHQRINMADVHGGPRLIKETIQYNLGVHVDYYARVDFAGFITIVNTLGGIDVVADCPLEDVFPDDPISEDPSITNTISMPEPGVYHLDGKHALWYARSRYTSPGGDLDRNRRQHRVLRGIWNKASELNFLANLPGLWASVSSSVETDLSWDDIVWLASLSPRLDASHIRSGFIDGAALQPWRTPSGASVYLPYRETMLEQVQDTFNPPSNIAAQAPVKVEVWNGTPYRDWDILATDRLVWAGYVVSSFRTADRQDYAQTTIVDYSTSPKGSRLPALMSLLRINQANVIAQPDPNSPVAYRIIVGTDYIPCVRPALPRYPTPTPSPSPAPAG